MKSKKKTVLISGGTNGIGLGMAKTLLADGFNVVAFSSSKDRCGKCERELKKEFDADSYVVMQADVTSEADVKRVVAATVKRFKTIDILINNAGILYFDNTDKYDTKRFKKMVDINVIGLAYLTRTVVPHMKKRKKGLIINFSSIAGIRSNPGGQFYSATKFGVRGFSEGLRLELAPFGIKVSTVYPGMVRTDLFDKREMAKREKANGGPLVMLDVGDVSRAISLIANQSEVSSIQDITIMPFGQ